MEILLALVIGVVISGFVYNRLRATDMDVPQWAEHDGIYAEEDDDFQSVTYIRPS